MGIVFIYSKEGVIQVYDIEQAKKHHDDLIKNDWVHESTLNACTFIERLYNDCLPQDLAKEIKDLAVT
jgi:hypothetical protein